MAGEGKPFSAAKITCVIFTDRPMDNYRNFKELQLHETEGTDFEICVRKGTSGIAIIAPHGGGIEPGTMDIADGIAGREHSFYCFKGIKPVGNNKLHIASDKFDEPLGIRITQEARHVLSIHGCTGQKDTVLVGGRDSALKKKLINALTRTGFNTEESKQCGLKGTSPGNICNRGRTGEGAQIEISESLRRKMFDRLSPEDLKKKRQVFHHMVETIRKVLEEYAALHPSDDALPDGEKQG